jgi:hypothetical protein
VSEALLNQLRISVPATRDQVVEHALWTAFDMDLFTDKMVNGISADESGPFMGTGHTDNACYMCSGSAYSATTANCCK